MNEWISVKDRLPDVDKCKNSAWESVYVIATNGKTSFPLVYERAVVRGKTVYRWRFVWDMIYDGDDITHWMPLPEPPEEDIQ